MDILVLKYVIQIFIKQYKILLKNLKNLFYTEGVS
jgi:hypothetical protein